MNIYRQEHPNPQWERQNWRNLNGEWEFEFDFGCSARDRKLFETENSLSQKINVPFCPESELSGIGYKDFINGVCYRKIFNISKEEKCGRVILHFGAVDFKTYLYINKKYVGKHIGGYSSFEFDITDYVNEGENVLFLAVEDDPRSDEIYAGKQSVIYNSAGCFYTRTTGIWQTVWLEFVPENYILSAKFYPDVANGTLTVAGETNGSGIIELNVFFDGNSVGNVSVKTFGGAFTATINLDEIHLWEVGKGNLYDLEMKFGEDIVKSYFGLRSIRMDGYKLLINEKPTFQRLVLDQGFYPDGIYTAKDEKEFVKDIEISLAAGFNGARLHQKVFEARFLYHCDRLGYIVWGEHGSYGMNYRNITAEENFINEWTEIVNRDFNHPSIIGWCPQNESWSYEDDNSRRFLETIYNITKVMDKTRICIDTSGGWHGKTDIFDIHDYTQESSVFAESIRKLEENDVLEFCHADREKNAYNGEAVFISEYGGMRWSDKEGWGYGEAPKTKEEFIERYRALTNAILKSKKICGFCYTQLYDVEQEQNGLYTYEREDKFDMSIFKKINSAKAAIEE